MCFIHTADWHLGNQLHDIDRREEAEAFLRWLKTQIIAHSAETLIVAGDIFDTVNPSTEARRQYYSFLASLVDTCCRNVVIIGGNHDSAVMLDAAKELLEVLHIRVVGSINNLTPEDMVIELKDADGETSAICLAVPFVREVELRNLLSADNAELPVEVSDADAETAATASIADGDLYSTAYKSLYDSVYAAAEKLRAGRALPLIATGHLYAADLEGKRAEATSSEKRDDGIKVIDVLGTLGNVPPAVFPPVDYVALGHIHYTSMVAKNAAVRYSGSPFVMGFDEADIPHYVLCVDASAGKPLSVEKLETPHTVDYRRLKGTLAEVKDALEALSAQESTTVDMTKPCYLELCYKREIGENVQEYLDGVIRALPANISVVSWKIMEPEQHGAFAVEGLASLDAAEVGNLDDKEVFTQLILSRSKLEPQSEEAQRALDKFLPLFLQLAES